MCMFTYILYVVIVFFYFYFHLFVQSPLSQLISLKLFSIFRIKKKQKKKEISKPNHVLGVLCVCKNKNKRHVSAAYYQLQSKVVKYCFQSVSLILKTYYSLMPFKQLKFFIYNRYSSKNVKINKSRLFIYMCCNCC